MYKCIERKLLDDAKDDFYWQDNLAGSCTVTKFNIVKATMTVHDFTTYAYRDYNIYIFRVI